jgi:hypothetical protein
MEGVNVIVAVWVAVVVLVEVGLGVIVSTSVVVINRVASFIPVFPISGSIMGCVAETEQEATRKARLITTRILMDTIDIELDDDPGLDSHVIIRGGQ